MVAGAPPLIHVPLRSMDAPPRERVLPIRLTRMGARGPRQPPAKINRGLHPRSVCRAALSAEVQMDVVVPVRQARARLERAVTQEFVFVLSVSRIAPRISAPSLTDAVARVVARMGWSVIKTPSRVSQSVLLNAAANSVDPMGVVARVARAQLASPAALEISVCEMAAAAFPTAPARSAAITDAVAHAERVQEVLRAA